MEAQANRTPRIDHALRLRDGRLLGYAECGAADGKPLFFFHGMPGSRREAELADDAANRLGVRIIAADRPGYGLSDFKPGRTFVEWPDDVLELADALGIERFAVAGVSGGGPYAAACALKIPQRLTAAAIISGVGPFDAPAATEGMSAENRLLFGTARRLPWLVNAPMWLMAQAVRRFPDRALSLTMRSLPEADRKVLARPEVWALFVEDIVEAYRQGARGASWEAILYSRPWDFRLRDIAMEVHLWQGEEDVNVPASMGRYQAESIPNCRATFLPGEGHLLIVDHMEEMLTALGA
jgi:pimeloyl-ACP methyl ester carboxylesterase